MSSAGAAKAAKQIMSAAASRGLAAVELQFRLDHLLQRCEADVAPPPRKGKPDPEGTHYLRFIGPTRREWQFISNRRVVENLQSHGDPLTAAREVNHWAYFKDPYDRSRFIQQVEPQGFVVSEHEAEAGSDPNRPRFCARASRVDRVDWRSTNEVTVVLFDAAEACDGEYDGWETEILKPDQG